MRVKQIRWKVCSHMGNDTPYVSFVAVGRNDNYGGHFLARMNTFVQSLTTLSEQSGLRSELIIVDWNPPRDRPPLREGIAWPRMARQFCTLRVIEVASEIHRKLPNWERIPLFEYVAKNVGVRRARGEYILVTNPDVIFSAELVRFLASRRLSPRAFYRIDRHDVRSPVPMGPTLEDQLAYCARNVIAVHGYWFSYTTASMGKRVLYRRLRAFAGHIRESLRYFPYPRPHVNASGDFFLMHRTHWEAMRGYQELDGAPHHIDSYMTHLALYTGLRQVHLRDPRRLYHQDHVRPEGGKPFSQGVEPIYRRMVRQRRPVVLNDGSWGLGHVTLVEYIRGDRGTFEVLMSPRLGEVS